MINAINYLEANEIITQDYLIRWLCYSLFLRKVKNLNLSSLNAKNIYVIY